jgi:hypothetical protein
MTGICALILSKYKNEADTPKKMMEHLKKYAKKLE